MRWLAAAVGELHRILLKGGLFIYPDDTRPGYAQGRLRLTYEAVPIAFLIEQAGGQATDGRRPILDLVPDSLHQMTPLIFGASDEVATIHSYLGSKG
jgi:fructose-1,6-bisphosphatase I